jgi:serine/threonine protein kinase
LKKGYTLTYFASGSLGTSYKGTRARQTFFIKEVESRNGNAVISLTQEMTLLQRLNHPGIVKVIDFFEENGNFYLVKEFIDGTALDKFLAQGSELFLQEKVVAGWAHQLFDLFEYLHRQNPPVIYRALMPQNIMKDADGRLFLLDFTNARIFRSEPGSDTIKINTGIPTISPEHYSGRQTDVRSDVYTLGALLHLMLTNNKATGGALLKFEPIRSINPKVSDRFAGVLDRALSQNPDQRFKSIEEMRAAMGRSQGEPCQEPRGGKEQGKQGRSSLPQPRGGATPAPLSPREKKEQLIKHIIIGACVLIAGLLVLLICTLLSDPQGRTGGASTAATQPVEPGLGFMSSEPLATDIGMSSPSESPSSLAPQPTQTFSFGRPTPSKTEVKPALTSAPGLPSAHQYPVGDPRRTINPPPQHTVTEQPTAAQSTVPPTEDLSKMTNEQYLAHLLNIDPKAIKMPEGKRTEKGIHYKNEKGKYYEVIIPEGYFQLGEPGETVQFATVRKEDPENSLILLKISYGTIDMPEGITATDGSLEKFYKGKLSTSNYRNVKDSPIRSVQQNGHSFDYTFTPVFLKKSLYCRDTVLVGQSGGYCYYAITVAAPASAFDLHSAALSTFSTSFFAPDLFRMDLGH